MLDRLTILRLKLARFRQAENIAATEAEHELTLRAWTDAGLPEPEAMDAYAALVEINGRLWHLENLIRAEECRRSFGRRFVHTILLVQRLNQTRATARAAAHQVASRLLGTDDQSIEVETSIDAAADRIAVLEVVAARTTDAQRRVTCRDTAGRLRHTWRDVAPDAFTGARFASLVRANNRLWDIKDQLDAHSAAGSSDDGRVSAGRSLYLVNDQRCRLKREIAVAFGATFYEAKEYVGYPMPRDWDPETHDWTCRQRKASTPPVTGRSYGPR